MPKLFHPREPPQIEQMATELMEKLSTRWQTRYRVLTFYSGDAEDQTAEKQFEAWLNTNSGWKILEFAMPNASTIVAIIEQSGYMTDEGKMQTEAFRLGGTTWGGPR